MLLFRSEEHVTRWLEQRNTSRGGTMTLTQLHDLATRWYRNRVDPDWTPRAVEESQAILTGVGLTGDFWQLQPPGGPKKAETSP